MTVLSVFTRGPASGPVIYAAALLNGKMICCSRGDQISSCQDVADVAAAWRHLDGGFRGGSGLCEESFVGSIAGVYIDFPEEMMAHSACQNSMRCAVRESLENCCYSRGRLCRDGALVVMAGPPNAEVVAVQCVRRVAGAGRRSGLAGSIELAATP